MPELSIVVPLLNEAKTLPGLLGMLTRQQAVDFEVLLVDGGSTDGTLETADSLAADLAFPVILHRAPRGRARQCNVGAAAARSSFLLFLHADSEFQASGALRNALDRLLGCGGQTVGGRFALRFSHQVTPRSWGYYFYECKARLDRPECIHGDQGLMVSQEIFHQLGGFDESAFVAEDTRFAEALRKTGTWLLFPDEIRTSARRFETEGLKERQTLNALIMNFAAIGWDEFFLQATGVYRAQGDAEQLDLFPFFDLVDQLQRAATWRMRLKRWYRTGCYVRPQAWQLAFALDVRRLYRAGRQAGEGSLWLTRLHDRWFERCTDHPPGRLLATLLTWLWFRRTLFRLRRGRG